MTTATQHKCDSQQVEIGDQFSRHSYGSVIGINYDTVRLRNQDGFEWTVGREIIEREFYFANQFTETKEVTRTEMAKIIDESARLIMTVHFHKKAEPKTLADLVERLLDSDDRPSRRGLQKQLKEATAGEERTLVGRHYGQRDIDGRIMFVDQEINERRPVNTRTIDWCILANIKYVLK